ncbi:hypothetical protein ACFX2I_040302 [Malus domestica]
MVAESLEKWHEKLGETLWAYRTSKRAGIGTTPYALTFGQDDVFPIEINVSSVRIQNQFGLRSEKYIQAMCQGVEDLDVARIEALNKIQEGKRVVAQAYNKKLGQRGGSWNGYRRMGHELRLRAIARKRIDKDYAKWSLKATVTFMYELNVRINDELMDTSTLEEKKAWVHSNPTKVFDIDPKTDKVMVVDPKAYTYDDEVIKKVEATPQCHRNPETEAGRSAPF